MSKSVDGGGGRDFAGKRRITNKKNVGGDHGNGAGALNDLLEKNPFEKMGQDRGNHHHHRGTYSSSSTATTTKQQQQQQQQIPFKDRTTSTMTKRRKDPSELQQQQRSANSSGSACSDQQQKGGGGGTTTATNAVNTRHAAPNRSTAPTRGGRAGAGSSSSGGANSTMNANNGSNDNNNNSNRSNNNNRSKKKSSPVSRPKDKLDSFLEKKSSQNNSNNKNNMYMMDSDDRSRGAYSTATHLRSKRNRTRVVKRSASGEDNNNTTSMTAALAALYNGSRCNATTGTTTTAASAHHTTPATAPATRRGSAGGAIVALGRRLSAGGGAAVALGNILHHGHANNNATESSSSSQTNAISNNNNAIAGSTNLNDSLHNGTTGPAATAAPAPASATRRGSAGGAIVALRRRLSAGGAAVALGNILHGHGHNNAESSSQSNTMNNNSNHAARSNLSDSVHSGIAGRVMRRESPAGGTSSSSTPATRRGSAGGTVAAFGRRMSAGSGAAVAALTSTVHEVEKNITNTAAAIENNIEKNLNSFLKLQKPRTKEDMETRSAYTTGGIDNRHRHRTHRNAKKPTPPLPSTKEELIECLRSGSNNNNARKKKVAPVAKHTNDPRKMASRSISPTAHRIKDLNPSSSSQPPPPQRKTRGTINPKAHQDVTKDGNGNPVTTSAARSHLKEQQSLRHTDNITNAARPQIYKQHSQRQQRSSSELKRRPKDPNNATLSTNKDRAGVNRSGNGESLSLQRPNPTNKHHMVAARGGTKSFDDIVLSPETARKTKLTGDQNNSTNRPRGGRKPTTPPTITPEMLQKKRLTARSIQAELQAEIESVARKIKKDAPSRGGTTITSKDSRNGDNATLRSGRQKPPQPKQKPNAGKAGGEEGPPRILNRTRSQQQVSARRMHTTHVTMQSPRPATRDKVDIATPKASNKKHSVFMMEVATPKANNTAARRQVNPQQGSAHHHVSDDEATPKIANTSKRLPESSAGCTSIPSMSCLNEYVDGADNNNNSQIVTPPTSPHQREVVRDFSPNRPIRREPERIEEHEEEPVAESSPTDVFTFYTWSKARQPENKVEAERQALKAIILDGPLDNPFDIQTADSQNSPRK